MDRIKNTFSPGAGSPLFDEFMYRAIPVFQPKTKKKVARQGEVTDESHGV